MRTWGGRRAALVGVCGLVLMTAACGSSGGGGSSGSANENASRGGTLNMLGAGDVDYMDPNISYYSVGYLALRLWSRQLFTFPAVSGQTTTAVPDLATQVPTTGNGGISKDGMTYTITIRQGAMWNTTPARQVTAADVVRGVKRTCNPAQPFGGTPDFATLIQGYQTFCDGFAKVAQTPSAIAGYIDKTPLPGVVAQGDTTVVFHLNHPATYFVDMLTLPAFSPAPVEVLKYLPASQALGQHEVSDGPYQVTTWTPTKEIVFTRNAAWKASTDPIRKAYVDKVVVNETVSQDSIQQQLQTGTASADMGFDQAPPPSQLPGLIAKKDKNLNLGETASSNPYLVFNTVSPNNRGALGDVRVRQALEYALNRSDMDQVLGGQTVNPPLTHILPPDISGSTDFNLYPTDQAKAKQMLAAAGYPHGMTLKFLYRNASEGSSKVFQTVQQQLSNIGVKVVGVPSPDADFYTKYLQVPSAARSGVWDLSLAGWGADWYGDAALSFFAPLFSGPPSYPPLGSNYGFYDSPKTNQLIQQASTATDQSKSGALWNQADHQVMQDAAIFPITNPQQASYHASQVHNAIYIPAFQNFDPANVWLSPGTNGG
ncbi:ABC transporter substrate-binding protein [Nocardioides sp. CER19]|uniref:ABC transporter substrate-binding protein n=1 Tax=Nocardioides sp. CER19 TaxID=3038538 RepID=UPI00244734FC|nr:ABC transporter substrate-binding protein [Nocardioides sp. CER19]MDH2413757.1 ABC transporter substrate-binding protein [Nocardioides sp. CER19]